MKFVVSMKATKFERTQKILRAKTSTLFTFIKKYAKRYRVFVDDINDIFIDIIRNLRQLIIIQHATYNFRVFQIDKLFFFEKKTFRSNQNSILTTKCLTSKMRKFSKKKLLEYIQKNYVENEIVIHEYCNFFNWSNHKFFQRSTIFNMNFDWRNVILTW